MLSRLVGHAPAAVGHRDLGAGRSDLVRRPRWLRWPGRGPTTIGRGSW